MPWKDPEKRKEYKRRYGRENRKYFRDKLRDWRKKNPERAKELDARKDPVKARARAALNNAIKVGKIIKPSKCPECGGSPVEAHHEDHSKPYDVIWLCKTCHGLRSRV